MAAVFLACGLRFVGRVAVFCLVFFAAGFPCGDAADQGSAFRRQSKMRRMSPGDCANVSWQRSLAVFQGRGWVSRGQRLRILPRRRKQACSSRRGKRRFHPQPRPKSAIVSGLPPSATCRVSPAAASPGVGGTNELRGLPRSARARDFQTIRRIGIGASGSAMRSVPSGAGAAFCVCARGFAGRLHDLSSSARLGSRQNAGSAGFASLFALSFADAVGSGASFDGQNRSQRFSSNGDLLDGGMPHGRSRFDGESQAALLAPEFAR